ncbi:IMPACT family protein [Nonlabens agnitus]|uniref:YigZ family protein n=1 Tax=Nonlabens agnitus TaxID=870484 RepID=A0A2S9WRJ1_9FLAO|nr:YigZ family protein [Nonlabens agnitus]PRP66100.1 YigZ family protein [Nonlabens agnitus]
MKDRYKTITSATEEILYKERGSKFYATAFPFTHEDQLNDILPSLRNKHPKAGHHCYAWKLGPTNDVYRSNDDGEPNHSAGDPILSQINAFEMSDVLVVVSRIFGGTKLGVGGLIQAYREAARLALDQTQIVERVITKDIIISFEYPQMSQVMRFVDEHSFNVKNQDLTETCKMTIGVPLNAVERTLEQLNAMYPITASV